MMPAFAGTETNGISKLTQTADKLHTIMPYGIQSPWLQNRIALFLSASRVSRSFTLASTKSA